jgi:large subunit ribosomal protein L22
MEAEGTKNDVRTPERKRRVKKRVRNEKLRLERSEHPRTLSRHVRLSAQKARLVCDQIRGKRVEEALGILEFTVRKGGKIVAKALRSVVANAENNKSLDVDTLYVKTIEVGPGPTLKRFLPRAQGRATPLLKRTSHISIVLDERA